MQNDDPGSTIDRILKWDDPNDDSDTCDLIHRHFTEISATLEDWGDVADEGLRLWKLMFEEDVESQSPIDGVLAGVAAAAYELAIEHIAKQIGVSGLAVRCALEWDNAGNAEAFVSECRRQNEKRHRPE